MKKNGIEFVGIEYTAARDRSSGKTISKEHAKLQMLILEKKHKLLPDKEVQKILSSKKQLEMSPANLVIEFMQNNSQLVMTLSSLRMLCQLKARIFIFGRFDKDERSTIV